MNIITRGNSSSGNHHLWPAVNKKNWAATNREIETNVTQWVVAMTINFYQQDIGKLLPPYDISTVVKNVWESRGMAGQLN
jgi:hypothetical protein